jgi:hypothetical protein
MNILTVTRGAVTCWAFKRLTSGENLLLVKHAFREMDRHCHQPEISRPGSSRVTDFSLKNTSFCLGPGVQSVGAKSSAYFHLANE